MMKPHMKERQLKMTEKRKLIYLKEWIIQMISVTKHERYAEIILRRGMHFIK